MQRTFLVTVCGFWLNLALAPGAVAAESPAAASTPARAIIESFLRREAIRLESSFLEGVTNRAQWEVRRAELRQQYLEMLGLWPLPERTPLAAQVTGVVEREEGFRVEKVHFQSRPRLYVTGNLYLPKDAAPGSRLPAVLYVCGHSGRGRDGNKAAFQHHGMWFATHGFACLIIDTLQLGEIAGIHHGTYRHDRWWWQARGYTPAAVECWNGIRALDYLESRPEVDPARLAVTGISGGGAATFWIAAADERVKVAVPVSGMSDLEDYVGAKVVNGHCDCMFALNTFQWPWTQIAALIAPRPLLFANSGHDPIFPMDGNDRIRARLERLYGFYTNRTDRLFDIGVTPGGHDDKPELRLMAYRWITWHLQGTNAPVTEPALPPIEGSQLRVFPGDLPADELNTTIDESFVPMATHALPATAGDFQVWRAGRLAELRRLVFRPLPDRFEPAHLTALGNDLASGALVIEPGLAVSWKYFPPASGASDRKRWLLVLGEQDSLESKPDWARGVVGDAGVLLVAPRGTGPMAWADPAPFYVQRALALLGRTVEGDRVRDVLGVAASFLPLPAPEERNGERWGIAGHGRAGVMAAYAALFEPRLDEIVLVDPPVTHRDGPIFLNVLRVLDIPEALGLLAPRSVRVYTTRPEAFERTASLYRAAGGVFEAVQAARLKATGSTDHRAAEAGFHSLFDGRTLAGWTVKCLPKDAALAAKAWSVDQGTILANTMGHKEHFYIMLVSDAEYGDFVLRLRFQVERGITGNSGIQIRSRYNADTGWMEGPQIDLNPPEPALTGKLWNEGPGPHRWLSNEPVPGFQFKYADEGDGWNDLEITAQGLRIRSVLNGVEVVDYDGAGVLDDAEHRQLGVGERGHLGLQIHSFHELKLRFKDIRLKPL